METKVSEKYIFKYIRDSLESFKTKEILINHARYHHNCLYRQAPSIIRRGILSLEELQKLGILELSTRELNNYDDIESHVNGTRYVSVSVQGLTDLYPYEEEFLSNRPSDIDFVISNRIVAGRNTFNYGNEFLVKSRINPEDIISLDIRLIKYLEENYKTYQPNSKKHQIILKEIIERYNYLHDIAQTLIDTNSSILLREMSNENTKQSLDIIKITTSSKILILK